MRYQNIKNALFIERPNRFIAKVMIDGREELAHVKNTGRCKELLIPGVEVFVQGHDDPKRKTRFSLIAVKKGSTMINMDSQAPNQAVGEWLAQGGIFSAPTLIKPEQKYGSSRFDFYMEEGEKKAFVEVKGVTLEEDKIARFPDAPTKRGIKHIEELVQCMKEGYEAYIVFVIQMKGIRFMEPNDKTHPAFGDALRTAKAAGVHVMAVDCIIREDFMEIDQKIPVHLEG